MAGPDNDLDFMIEDERLTLRSAKPYPSGTIAAVYSA
jgi:hypothetical protein